MTDYKIWKPERDGHAPPNWKKGMPWASAPYAWSYSPSWPEGSSYMVPVEAVGETIPMTKGETVRYGDEGWQPAEALNSPNDDATAGQKIIGALEEAIAMVRAASPETLQKHGITLAPERDEFDDLAVLAWHSASGPLDKAAPRIAGILRTRFEQMLAERSKRDA